MKVATLLMKASTMKTIHMMLEVETLPSYLDGIPSVSYDSTAVIAFMSLSFLDPQPALQDCNRQTAEWGPGNEAKTTVHSFITSSMDNQSRL